MLGPHTGVLILTCRDANHTVFPLSSKHIEHIAMQSVSCTSPNGVLRSQSQEEMSIELVAVVI